MNGAAVLQAMREHPPETLTLEPYDPVTPVLGYFTARNASLDLETMHDEPTDSAARLTQYIFHRHPHALDLVATMAHRYVQARGYMTQYSNGPELLGGSLLNHFQGVAERLTAGYIAMPTSTVLSFSPDWPRPEFVNGELCQKVYIPPVVQARSLVWNHWAQAKSKPVKPMNFLRMPFTLMASK